MLKFYCDSIGFTSFAGSIFVGVFYFSKPPQNLISYTDSEVTYIILEIPAKILNTFGEGLLEDNQLLVSYKLEYLAHKLQIELNSSEGFTLYFNLSTAAEYNYLEGLLGLNIVEETFDKFIRDFCKSVLEKRKRVQDLKMHEQYPAYKFNESLSRFTQAKILAEQSFITVYHRKSALYEFPKYWKIMFLRRNPVMIKFWYFIDPPIWWKLLFPGRAFSSDFTTKEIKTLIAAQVDVIKNYSAEVHNETKSREIYKLTSKIY